jgi:hypothetical protein
MVSTVVPRVSVKVVVVPLTEVVSLLPFVSMTVPVDEPGLGIDHPLRFWTTMLGLACSLTERTYPEPSFAALVPEYTGGTGPLSQRS